MTEEIALNISRKRINYFVNGTRIFTWEKNHISISHHLENIKSRGSKDINIKIITFRRKYKMKKIYRRISL